PVIQSVLGEQGRFPGQGQNGGACCARRSQRGAAPTGRGRRVGVDGEGRAGVGISVGAPPPGANGGRQPAPGSGALLIDASQGGGVEATIHIQRSEERRVGEG